MVVFGERGEAGRGLGMGWEPKQECEQEYEEGGLFFHDLKVWVYRKEGTGNVNLAKRDVKFAYLPVSK
jgi:hypothetical protein